MNRRRTAGIVASLAGFIAVAVATLTPVRDTLQSANVWCLACSSLATADALVNIVLFVPAGIGVGLLARRVAPAVVGLTLVSVAIEALQAWLIPGRDGSARDVLTNTMGGVVGIVLARHWRLWLLPQPAVAGRLAVAAAVVWAATLGATAALTHPSIPPGAYWGQRGGDGGFRGSVVHVAVNERAVPLGPLTDPGPVLAAFESGNARVDVVVTPSALPAATGPIARLSNPGTEVFRLAQRGRDLTFSVRLRSADGRLRSPVVRLRADFVHREGEASPVGTPTMDTVHVQAGLRNGVLRLARNGSASSVAELRLSPTVGWAFLAPLGIVARTPPWVLTGFWVSAFCFPIGYWTAAARRGGQRSSVPATRKPRLRRLQLGVVTALVGGTLALLPLAAGAAWPEWWDWCFALAALLGGALAERVVPGAVVSAGAR